ncbi:hypothetical protein Q73A0000_13090 [Kaistella flava (ex Peng et al. 2021)]|uniref:Uncharacterized protein n=1 Tax=Kaistella flava (ex Peng et al. 2021) TaxID=2038776 RepID=A0A7M2YAT5_9FLAO|nr:hypothetical protein [Kaistella flava (ex Peng et al. 2021)]QOW11226.1 hypothetical protein Q73A0000_13090 [Kaistella flava (ex Peng et al. 2021)]
MNGRILELAKNPELFQIKDLELLNSEINKHPYIQSLRALHLLGTHRLKPENYTNELSITAAYTTDKKILYQLINSVEEPKPSVEVATKTIVEKPITTEETKNKFTEIKSKVTETPKAVFVNGELNRILFEGEEDLLERETEKIDFESTIEAGQIITHKVEFPIPPTEKVEFAEAKDAETFSKETIIKEEIISEEKELIENPSELSFHETAEFLPEVKVDAPIENSKSKEVQEFAETEDAENFSTETIVNEDIIIEEKALFENPSELSFHETAEFSPEVKVDAPIENSETQEVQEFTETQDAETFSKETVFKENIIAEEEPIIEDSSELSFHATAEFLPDVKIGSVPAKVEVQEIVKPTLNKHEEEMKRLIAEVEAKMKASKKPKAIKAEETSKSAEVNFSETQSFDLSKSDEKESEIAEKEAITEKETVVNEEPFVEEKAEVQPTEIIQQPIEIKVDTVQEKKPEWKPMSFSTNTPDALISKKAEETPVKTEEIKEEKISIEKEEKMDSVKEETPSAERPVFNVSFFTQNVSALEKENKKEEIIPVTEEEKSAEIVEDSNVPSFINTWQSWLKIDRTKQDAQGKIEISITEIKNKVIENFIEKEPRISKLKEESDFVIKERNDDISHLMTETLANLYTEQKLYAKAIKAFGILSEKHPEKKPHFDDKIKQIKELRQNK